MRPVDFPGTNVILEKPDNMTDEECLPMTAFEGVDDGGHNFYLTAWMPNKEDKEAIAKGKPIFMKTTSKSFAPTSLFTMGDDHKPNY